jgi:antitoxin component YwqK of YwqJK toxin-antitoxin module
MRNIFLILALFFGSAIYAQEGDGEKAVCKRFEDGSLKETGLLKDGKLHGRWVQYSESGEAVVVAYYNEGKKTGNWLFLDNSNGEIKELEFVNNKVKTRRTFVFDSPKNVIGYKQ